MYKNSAILIAFLLYPILVCSWWEEGHMLVAQIAYMQLPEPLKDSLDILVTQFSPFYPKSSDFPSSAVWADDLKTEAFNAFDNWHFVTNAYNPENLTLNIPTGVENVTWAIIQAVKTLNSSLSSPWGQATMLRLLLHFVGDIHQPCHVCSLYDNRFPNGNLGGNFNKIVVNGTVWNLHSFWDSGAGYYSHSYNRPLSAGDLKSLYNTASDITTRYPKSYFDESEIYNTNYTLWMFESFELAIDYVYLNHTLKYNETVTASYVDNAKEVVDRQIALGGYRLASLLSLIAIPKKEPLVCSTNQSDQFLMMPAALAGVVIGSFLVGSFLGFLVFKLSSKFNKKNKEQENTPLVHEYAK